MRTITLSLMLSTTVLLTACTTPTPPTADSNVYDQMDKLAKSLATRASTNLGQADDFQILVTQAAYPVGTLMRTGSTIPVDYTACLPGGEPGKDASVPKLPVPNMFPQYTMTKSVAADFGLDSAVIKELAEAGVNFKDSDTVNLTIKEAQIQTLSDNDLKKLLSRSDCSSSIPKNSAWLVRGYVIGQRNFVLKREASAGLKAGIVKIGTFKLNKDGSAALNIVDDSQIGFLQIVSQVTATPTNTGTPIVSKPVATRDLGRVFVQRDRMDVSRTADIIVASLKAGSFKVASSIEVIDSSKMPRLAQIRYFNDGDKQSAEQALIELKKHFPSAILSKVSLPAPVGQLEVWLPKAFR